MFLCLLCKLADGDSDPLELFVQIVWCLLQKKKWE